MDFPEVVESIDTPTKKRKLKEEDEDSEDSLFTGSPSSSQIQRERSIPKRAAAGVAAAKNTAVVKADRAPLSGFPSTNSPHSPGSSSSYEEPKPRNKPGPKPKKATGSNPSSPVKAAHPQQNLQQLGSIPLSSAADTIFNGSMPPELIQTTSSSSNLHTSFVPPQRAEDSHATKSKSSSSGNGHLHSDKKQDSRRHQLSEAEREDSDDEMPYHPEVASKGLLSFPDEEIEQLWFRLADTNQLLLFKQFIRHHPENIAHLYKLADLERNNVEFVKTKMPTLESAIRGAINAKRVYLIEQEASAISAEARNVLWKASVSRSENPALDAAIVVRAMHFIDSLEVAGLREDSMQKMLDFIDAMLLVVNQHLLRGKYDPAFTLLSTVVEAYVKSPLVNDVQLSRDDELRLAAALARCIQRYADNEYTPSRGVKIFTKNVEQLKDSLKSEDISKEFDRQLKSLRLFK